jgi:hypothetical protein
LLQNPECEQSSKYNKYGILSTKNQSDYFISPCQSGDCARLEPLLNGSVTENNILKFEKPFNIFSGKQAILYGDTAENGKQKYLGIVPGKNKESGRFVITEVNLKFNCQFLFLCLSD